ELDARRHADGQSREVDRYRQVRVNRPGGVKAHLRGEVMRIELRLGQVAGAVEVRCEPGAQVEGAVHHFRLQESGVQVKMKVVAVGGGAEGQAAGMKEKRLRGRQTRRKVEPEGESKVHRRLEFDRRVRVQFQAQLF